MVMEEKEKDSLQHGVNGGGGGSGGSLSFRSSSPSPLRPRPDTVNAHYAFLVHSQRTLPLKLPPNVDNKPLARQKRRRTSPEDQTILETEFQKNSKPDKATRMNIVSRVALGEKEVRIWFQNRRQNESRRSRPLPAGEMASSSAEGSDPADPHGSESVSSSQGSDQRDTSLSTAPESQTSQSQGSNTNSGASHTPSHESHESFTSSQPSQSARSEPCQSQVTLIPRLKKESSSSVRLSLSLDGKAKVMTTEELSPPKPRSLGMLAGQPLQRSQSFNSAMDRLANSSDTRSSRPSGRSRDSRTWEFYCDSDARNSLSEKAERERRGSAAGAIEMMRSNSTTSTTNSTTKGFHTGAHKRNAPLERTSESEHAKRLKSHRRMLKRTTSSVARLQSADAKYARVPSPSAADSDKENDLPRDGTGNPRRRRPLRRIPTGQNGRAVLRDSSNIPSHSTSLDAALTPGKSGGIACLLGAARYGKSRANAEPDIPIFEDPETSTAPRGLPQDDEDLKCVQNLLSLSQGGW